MAIQAVLLIISFLMYDNVMVVIVLGEYCNVRIWHYLCLHTCPVWWYHCIQRMENGKKCSRLDQRTSKTYRWRFLLWQEELSFLHVWQWEISVRILIRRQFLEELKRAISLGFMIIPAAALIIAVVALVFGFRLTKDKVDQYAQEIASRS